MKIVTLENGCHVLYTNSGKFTGAGVRGSIGDTHIIWYSGTAEINDTEACNMIRDWVLKEGGKGYGCGMCTSTQSWTEWYIPKTLEDLLQKYS